MIKKNIAILLLAVFIGSCDYEKKATSSHLNCTSSIIKLINNQNIVSNKQIFSRLANELNDNIVRDSNKHYYFRIYDSVNNESQVISTCMAQIITELGERVYDLNACEICINGNNSVFIDNSPVEISSIEKKIKDYYCRQEGFEYSTQQTDSTLCFSEIKFIQILFVLHANVLSKRGLSDDEWTLFNESYKKIMIVRDEARNKLSIKKFGCPFSKLSFSKKKVIVEYRPSNVLLFFNMDCSKVAPPPPM